MQNCFHHSQWFVIFSTPTPDFINSQTHKVVMDTHQEHIQVQLLRNQMWCSRLLLTEYVFVHMNANMLCCQLAQATGSLTRDDAGVLSTQQQAVNTGRTKHTLSRTYIQSALKCLGELDETFDDQITELGEHLLALLLQLVRRTAHQDHQGQKGVCSACKTNVKYHAKAKPNCKSFIKTTVTLAA